MLSLKKILAGRGAVDYYLNQTRRGLADYYLGEHATSGEDVHVAEGLSAPGASWWGGGAEVLEPSGEVERRQFVPLYAKGAKPDGGYLGRRFRTQEDAAEARADRLAKIEKIADPYEPWEAQQELARSGSGASVAAWDASFSPVKSESLLWDLIRRRWREIREHVADHDGLLPYARDLGPRPDNPADARSWITAVTAITAYRERYDLPHHVQLLGERPGALRPDAQAAYDHALHQHDHHLARTAPASRYRRAAGAARRRSGSGRTEQHDPGELQQASIKADQTRRHWRTTTAQPDRTAADDQHQRARLTVDSLERLAADHRQARDGAHRARDHARQLDLLPRQTDSPARR